MDVTQINVSKVETSGFREQLRPAIVGLLLFTFLTGLIYPAVVTGLAQLLFRDQANGSIITTDDGSEVGSELIGQQFTDPAYFWSRPSATGDLPYNGAVSSGTNYGPLSDDLMAQVDERIAAYRAADPDNDAPIPVDLVTASGSGLDPHISVAGAEFQIARVARERGLPEEQVSELVERYTENRTFGLLGEPGVNVLKLNLALDELSSGE
jgi:K+-transporting ATPase ATPase C chain